ncbi:MAG: D-threonate 4-phosphate dehydrogenase [Fibrobacteria bacterium]|nr:D-threonate 4-phosphate dehydrogenase [Fibrobacteria bacterium]
MKTVLLTLGDAAGIGPEVLVKCLAAVPAVPGIHPLVVGELGILRATAQSLGIPLRFVEEKDAGENLAVDAIPVRSLGLLVPGSFEPGKLSAACGDAAYRYFVHAVDECLAGRAHALVTAPLNKEAMNLGGHAFVGHTDILEQRTGVAGPVMALWHPKIVVGHVTDHLPLRQALDAITGPRVAHVVRLTREALVKTGTAAPRIALAGINPHAGENGLFGREEIEILRPAMAALKAEGIDVSGPHPGDTVFLQALRGRFDAVIAMYHDQGFGPMKTLDFANGVNCTLGLPFVRTSPDHGTAFEIAGRGVAEPDSMIAAYKLAVRLLD